MELSHYIASFEGFPDPVVITDSELRVVSTNAVFGHLSGYQLSDLADTDFSALLSREGTHPHNRDNIHPNRDIDLLSKQERIAFQTKDGSHIVVELRSSAITDEAGKRIATCFVLRDLSARTCILTLFEAVLARTARGIEPMANWFADILDLGCNYLDLDVGFICHGEEGTAEILQASSRQSHFAPGTTIPLNKSFCARFHSELGMTTTEVSSCISSENGPIDENGVFHAYVAAPICIGSEFFGMLAFVGEQERLQSFSDLETAAVKLLARFVGERLSDDRRSQEKASMAERLAKSEARYKSLFRSVPAMLVYRDAEGAITDVTDRYAEHFGFERDELIGKRIADLVAPASKARTESKVRMIGRQHGKMRNEPFEMLTKSGEKVDIEVSAQRQDDGMVLGAIVDVSDRNRAQSELEKHNRELERANESLKHFTSIASHDMQEPLRKIRYFSDLLQQAMATGNQADIDYSLNVLSDAAGRASILVSDLLAFSRASNKELDRETIDLHDLIEGVIGEFKRESAVKASFTLDMPHLVVSGDRTAIIQMMRNLLGNSLKYRHPERVPAVEISVRFDDGEDGEDGPATIRIKDNGIGFDPDYAQMIMKPFSRLHRRSQYPGSGVGLAICDVVAQRHKWTMHAEGRPDEGATFEIEIPLYFIA